MTKVTVCRSPDADLDALSLTSGSWYDVVEDPNRSLETYGSFCFVAVLDNWKYLVFPEGKKILLVTDVSKIVKFKYVKEVGIELY